MAVASVTAMVGVAADISVPFGTIRDEANFRNSLMLNRRGSALFTKELVRRAKEASLCVSGS